jgi:nucleotide-binding universal stress UspA family protein
MTASVPTEIHPIIVAVDGSPSSLEAIRQGHRLAGLLGTHVLAVSAWHQQNGLFPPMSYHPDEDCRQLLSNSLREAFYPAKPPAIETLAANGDPAEVLIRLSGDAAMVVVGSRGHSGVVGAVLGSVSGRIAAHAACPVLVVHDPAQHRAVHPLDKLRTVEAVDALTGASPVAVGNVVPAVR